MWNDNTCYYGDINQMLRSLLLYKDVSSDAGGTRRPDAVAGGWGGK